MHIPRPIILLHLPPRPHIPQLIRTVFLVGIGVGRVEEGVDLSVQRRADLATDVWFRRRAAEEEPEEPEEAGEATTGQVQAKKDLLSVPGVRVQKKEVFKQTMRMR